MARWTPEREDPLLRSRALHTPNLALGRFHLRPGHRTWDGDNQIGPWPLIAFPTTAVEIRQQRHRSVVATAGVAMFYDPSTVYTRRLVDPRGDHCRFVGLDHDVLADILDHHGVAVGRTWFPWPRGPVAAGILLQLEAVLRQARAGATDDLAIEESVLTIVEAVVGAACAAHRRIEARRPALTRRHRAAAHHLERMLARDYRRSQSLQELADGVGMSRFHAARVFRAVTGHSLHGFRDQLRVRAALHALQRYERLDELALELGFSSHSHLTDRFRNTFGVPPSAVRDGHVPR